MRFSQRIGKTSATKEIQLVFMDEELKNGLWNFVKLFSRNSLKKYSAFGR